MPVSEDAQIVVKLWNPALEPVTTSPPTAEPVPSSSSDKLKVSTSATLTRDIPGEVRIADNLRAHWEGADALNVDVSALGKDGKFCWLVEPVPKLEKVHIVAQWEVTMSVDVSRSVLGI